MRKKLKILRAKTGNLLTAPRALLDDALYREHAAIIVGHKRKVKAYDTGFSGFRNASRPRDQAVSLRACGPTSSS